MLGLSSVGTTSEAWVNLDEGVISDGAVVVRTGTSIIVCKGWCGDSRTVMLVADSMGSM